MGRNGRERKNFTQDYRVRKKHKNIIQIILPPYICLHIHIYAHIFIHIYT